MSKEFEAHDFEAQIELQHQISLYNREFEKLKELRVVNLPKNVQVIRKNFVANKSDLKKSTAFVKKIKSTNAEGIQQCLRDCETLNLYNYISEIISAIVATNYKATDVSNMIKLCTTLHQKYEDFTDPLNVSLKNALIHPQNEDDSDSGKKKRIQIRFVIELFQAGIFLDEEFFCTLLRILVGRNKA
jgi:hypothetical protein